MSVRRLADESLQPASFAFSAENDNWATTLIGRYPVNRQQSAVIPLLMRAQEQDGWVTRAAIEHVADRLAMPLIRVLEVATFYTQFQLKPVGSRAHVQVCGTTPCMLRGADALKDVCRKRIHGDQFHLNEAGTLSWEEVECLGACVNAPMVMVFKDTYEDLTPERLGEIIDALEAGETVKPGPQIDRHLSVPVGGLTTLDTFRDDDEIGDRTEGAAQGRPSREAGGAERVSPSQSGRVDTHAQETDPSIESPGAKTGAAVHSGVEEAASADPDEGAGPGAGRTGGSRQGETGAEDRDEDAEAAANRDASAGPAAGGDKPLPDAEGAAEAAVVAEKFRPEDGGGAQDRSTRGKPRSGTKVEAGRGKDGDVDAAAGKAEKPAPRRKASKKPTGGDAGGSQDA